MVLLDACAAERYYCFRKIQAQERHPPPCDTPRPHCKPSEQANKLRHQHRAHLMIAISRGWVSIAFSAVSRSCLSTCWFAAFKLGPSTVGLLACFIAITTHIFNLISCGYSWWSLVHKASAWQTQSTCKSLSRSSRAQRASLSNGQRTYYPVLRTAKQPTSQKCVLAKVVPCDCILHQAHLVAAHFKLKRVVPGYRGARCPERAVSASREASSTSAAA